MDVQQIQDFIEERIDGIIRHDLDEVTQRVREFKLKYNRSTKEKIAAAIVKDQSIWGGILAVPTGLGGLFSLPATVPIDLVKYLRVQSYMICCLRNLYEYPLNDTDAVKTDLFLLMSHSSIDELKDFVCREAEKQTKNDFHKKEALRKLRSRSSYKDVATKMSTNLGMKYAPKIAMKVGEKQVMNYTLRGVPKIFRSIIWRLGGRKIAEKTMQKAAGKVIPILGAAVGGSIDWWTIRATGNVAIDYYQENGPDFLNAAYSLIE